MNRSAAIDRSAASSAINRSAAVDRSAANGIRLLMLAPMVQKGEAMACNCIGVDYQALGEAYIRDAILFHNKHLEVGGHWHPLCCLESRPPLGDQ